MSQEQVLFSVADVVEWTGGTLLQGSPSKGLTGFSNDSRQLEPGQLFVALVAERDGHDFVPGAITSGASALLVQRPVEDVLPDVAVIQVEDSLQSLGAIALGYRRTLPQCRVVGITGSNGKTTTKEMLASIFRQIGPTHATAGNYNNLIGVPLTLMGLRKEHQFAVLEMGMNAFGEIAQLAAMSEPHVGVITCVAPAHLEGVGSIEGVAQAKGELFDALSKDQWAIVNADDPMIMARAESLECHRLYVTSQLPNAAIPEGQPALRITRLEPRGVDGFLFDVSTENLRGPGQSSSFSVELPLVGHHQVSNAMMATAAALASGATEDAVTHGLREVEPTGRRLRLIHTAGNLHVLDDCYNSNPHSCRAALRTLTDLAQGQTTIAVLGDMLELGENEHKEHAEVGAYAQELGVDHVLGFGPISMSLVRGAQEAGLSETKAQHFLEVNDLWSHLETLLDDDVWLLVKGSRGMRLERVSEKLVSW
ncbi:MAG: UDP-N-acetylmuramoyl-tripeptide--D-alanyl-D-alanine ligase [Deltaproteobacteria bacterium]|nr:MAG: UDP-N-acetylmuramoyl-tripeptide--D-alanyl-D-alanine ligase [Deltaproteobacteria bacterium]